MHTTFTGFFVVYLSIFHSNFHERNTQDEENDRKCRNDGDKDKKHFRLFLGTPPHELIRLGGLPAPPCSASWPLLLLLPRLHTASLIRGAVKYTSIDGFLFTGFLSSHPAPAFAFPMTGLVGFEWTRDSIFSPIPASPEKVGFFLYCALVRANKSLGQRETHGFELRLASPLRHSLAEPHSGTFDGLRWVLPC